MFGTDNNKRGSGSGGDDNAEGGEGTGGGGGDPMNPEGRKPTFIDVSNLQVVSII